MTLAPSLRRLDTLDQFQVPPELEARGPAEGRSVCRDEVRLMVTEGKNRRHTRFRELPSILRTGDLLVVNNSATLPASVRIEDVVVNFSTTLPGGLHIVELRRPSGPGSLPWEGVPPTRTDLPGGAQVDLLAPYPVDSKTRRLWVAYVEVRGTLSAYLARWGDPIRYPHVDEPHPLSAYQTVFATIPGSAEMASAGRPFSHRLLTELMTVGVAVAPLTLHTGVSSLESGEGPYPEWFDIPAATAALVDHTRRRGGRVVAVGTTVVRALETTADDVGRSHPGRGWTELVVGRDRPLRLVDALITGWHEPASTHLDMLEAMAGRETLADSYRAALAHGYLWHEFGDSHLIIAAGR